MDDIAKLPGVTDAEIASFRQHKIETIDSLWQAVGKEKPVAGAARAVLETGIDEARLTGLWTAQQALANTDAISQISGIQSQEISRFTALNCHTIADLRRYLTDPTEWRGIRIVAKRLGIQPDRLRDLLLAQGLAEVETENKSWWQQNAVKVVGTVVSLLFLLLLVRALIVSDWWRHLLGAAETQVVVAATDLSPYQVLTAPQLTMKPVAAVPEDAFAEADKLVGRLLLVPIAANDPITKTMVSETAWPADMLQDRVVLPLAMPTSQVSAAAVPGARVTLLFAGYMQGETAVPPLRVADVLLLTVVAVEDEVQLVTAVTPADLGAIAPYLGQTSAIVVQPIP
jgi:hypothetical protein